MTTSIAGLKKKKKKKKKTATYAKISPKMVNPRDLVGERRRRRRNTFKQYIILSLPLRKA